MLKAGFFQTPEKTYSVYEIDESGFYRIDFLEQGTTFNVDIPLFSQVVKRYTFTYGDESIFKRYNNAMTQMLSIQKQVTKTQDWVDGKFVTKIHSENEKFNCVVDQIIENTIETETTIHINEIVIYLYVVSDNYGIKLQPSNFSDYTKLTLSKDTVYDVTNSIFYSLEQLQRKYDIAHIDSNDYVVATDLETARRRLKDWDECTNPYKGFDTETTGVDVNLYGEDHLVGIILGESLTKSTYFPFRHVSGLQNLPIEFLSELMECVLRNSDILVAHNKKFDRKVMLKEGYDLHIHWDTLWGSMILNPVIAKGTHDEKTLTYNLTHLKFLELNEIFISAADINFSVLTGDIVRVYACPDGTNVLRLIDDQMKRIPKNQMRLWEMENVMADICADMEYYGIRVDVKRYEKQYENCNFILDRLLKAFRILTHEDGNLNSPEVLKNLIYNRMQCPVVLRTETGEPSTSSAVIKMLGSRKAKEPSNITEDLTDMNGKVVISAKELANSAYPAMLILAKYKEYNKLKTAFYARFERTMSTGRVFFWINQWGAATGRQASPMHQLPPELKDCILADSSDKDFWGPDYSQVELRMIAYLSGEKDLIDMACNPDNDIHRVIGALINDCEMWQITKEMRSTGKRRNFGVVYLISAFGLAAQMFGPGYTKENVEFCQQQLDAFYNRFKRIDRYIKNNAKLVQRQGYMETRWFHRVRKFDQIFDANLEPRKRASILRMANNVPVQGTAADYMKLGEIQMYKWIQARGWNRLGKDGFPLVRMMLSIHDELIISSDRSIPYEEIITMITKCMETPVEGAPPFFVQPALMDNWGGHSDDACAMPIKLRDKLIEDYLRTGVSVINHDNYLQVLSQYREDELKNYMSSLINKYGPDPLNVGMHVRDGVLTFALLDLYEKKIKKQFPDIDQVELINKATEMYMDDVKVEVVDTASEDEEVQISDKDRFNDQLENLVNFDSDGNVIFEETEETTRDMVISEEDAEAVDMSVDKSPTYAWTIGDNIVVDTIDIDNKEDIDGLLRYMMKYRDSNGFFHSYIIYNDKMLDTGIPMENCNIEELNSYIINIVQKQAS